MIAIVGATGVLGAQLLATLDDPEGLILFASERSLGKEVEVAGESLEIVPVDFKGVKTALIATPLAAAKPLIDAARAAGARVIDFSGAYRSDLNVPLWAPGINEAPAGASLITIAGASGAALATLLKPLDAAWVDITALYGAAHRGNAGVARLEDQTRALLSGLPTDETEPFAHTLGFNVLPEVGAFAKGHPHSSEELAVALELSRTLGPKPLVHLTALHVPVFHGLMFSLHGQGDATKLQNGPRLKVIDAPDEGIYPTARLAADDDAVHVGRIRSAGDQFWCVAAVDPAAFVARASLTIWQTPRAP